MIKEIQTNYYCTDYQESYNEINSTGKALTTPKKTFTIESLTVESDLIQRDLEENQNVSQKEFI